MSVVVDQCEELPAHVGTVWVDVFGGVYEGEAVPSVVQH